ncbi:DUF4142 domain-containing protein [Sphingomicrobium nitratireducens]|uniref:DUF4142 domain-containing protein n=1 Tax=Sphingomicrobium nitratireducens TaxID=2964666 RepID=UPI00224002A1|nr:DUF4142 domain-containing protein [Sphingomicrobium nitratireducens]
MVNAKFLGATVALGLLASIAPGNPAAPIVPQAAASQSGATLSAALFVNVAASSALYSVKAADIARARSRDRDVRALAKLQRRNALGIAGQLSFAGRRLNLLPRAELLPEHKAMLRSLRSTPTFDHTYLQQQRGFVPDALDFHRTYARRGDSPTLRPVAQMGAQLLEGQVRAIDRTD